MKYPDRRQNILRQSIWADRILYPPDKSWGIRYTTTPVFSFFSLDVLFWTECAMEVLGLVIAREREWKKYTTTGNSIISFLSTSYYNERKPMYWISWKCCSNLTSLHTSISVVHFIRHHGFMHSTEKYMCNNHYHVVSLFEMSYIFSRIYIRSFSQQHRMLPWMTIPVHAWKLWPRAPRFPDSLFL